MDGRGFPYPRPENVQFDGVHLDLAGVDRMSTSEILQKDHEDLIRLCQRMKPEERLIAFFHHSQLTHQMYQAGVDYRRRWHRSCKHRNLDAL